MPEELAKEIGSKYDIGPKLASQLVNSDYLGTFEGIVTSAKGVAPSFIATVLTESLRSLARDQVAVENVKDSHLKEVFSLVAEGKTAKESVVEILKWLSSHPDASARDAIGELKLSMMTHEELVGIISKALESNRFVVLENGTKALGKMVNLVMGEVRGRADAKLVTELLRTRIEQFKG